MGVPLSICTMNSIRYTRYMARKLEGGRLFLSQINNSGITRRPAGRQKEANTSDTRLRFIIFLTAPGRSYDGLEPLRLLDQRLLTASGTFFPARLILGTQSNFVPLMTIQHPKYRAF